MNIRLQTRHFRFANLLFGLFLVCQYGCASNLSQIREFAGISVESTKYTKLIATYVNGPLRQKFYQPQFRHDTLDLQVRAREAQEDRLLFRHLLLRKYFNLLDNLAVDEIGDYKQLDELKKLNFALQNPPGVNPEGTEALSKIVGILYKATFDRWRQRQLPFLIEQSNPPLQVILGVMKEVVQDGFGGDLLTEEAAMQIYYTTLIMESTDPAGRAALMEWQEVRLLKLENQRKAIQQFGVVLDKIAKGHQILFDNRNNLSNEMVLEQIRKHSNDLQKTLKALLLLELFD